MWALGGGSKIIDIAARKADGFATAVPFAWPTPEKAAEEIRSIRGLVASVGRDPEEFEFGIWCVALLHEDPEMIERALANPLVRWQAAIFGRLNQADWDAEGLEPPMPRDWHYAAKLEPMKVDDVEAKQILSGVTDEIARRSFLVGSPADVADQLQGFREAGASWIHVSDLLPLTTDLAPGEGPMDRTYEVFRRLRGTTSS
jgi:phthiodiolone/phenolphthiodiolone dimycocerosates ketoreductase